MLARNLQPIEDYPGANKPWKCKCLDCGNFVQPHYAHIQQGRKGCSFCASKNLSERTRRPQDEVFKIARESGWEPLEPYNSRHKPWKCKCQKCGKVSNAYLASMLAGFGCKHCSGLIVNPLEAEQLMLKSNLKPLVPYPGSGVPWKCLCLKCKKEVFPRYSTVRVRIGGCKYCATHGFDFSKGGILYVITHELLGAHKIGITNEAAKEKRLKKHEAEGWLTYKTVFFENGNDAFEIEQQILTWWRTERGLPMYLSSAEMPQGGHTETVDSNEIDLMDIGNQIEVLMTKLREEGSKSSGLKTTNCGVNLVNCSFNASFINLNACVSLIETPPRFFCR
jgi:Zn finger protein HypA/HybF involved in hydrogenase expression